MAVVNFTNKAKYENYLVAAIIRCIEKYGGKDYLSSIILTGSFGRGEPTYVVEENGYLDLKSDVEIALVYQKDKASAERLVGLVSAEFQENLNLMTISEKRVKKAYNFNYSFRVPKYKTIFTYDLFNGSRTVWGRDFLEQQKISLDCCDIYEAKRLVANRIGELVYTQNEKLNNKEYFYIQWKGKLMLAIASAWLICEKKYVSSYHGQYNVVCEKAHQIDAVIGTGFVEDYKKAFSFLRECGELYEIPDENLIGYIKQMDMFFRGMGIKKPRVNSLSRKLKYGLKYLKTGMKYGIIGYEDGILQSLITDYWKKEEKIIYDAKVWYKVLY